MMHWQCETKPAGYRIQQNKNVDNVLQDIQNDTTISTRQISRNRETNHVQVWRVILYIRIIYKEYK